MCRGASPRGRRHLAGRPGAPAPSRSSGGFKSCGLKEGVSALATLRVSTASRCASQRCRVDSRSNRRPRIGTFPARAGDHRRQLQASRGMVNNRLTVAPGSAGRRAGAARCCYLSRRVGEAVIINNAIEVRVVEVKGKTVKLGLTFPPEASVLREEVFVQIRARTRPRPRPRRHCRTRSRRWRASTGAGTPQRADGPAAGRHHHGQPVRLGDHAPRRRDARALGVAARGAHRLGPPHARPALRLRQGRQGGRLQGDHRRRRRRRAPARHDRRDDRRCRCSACRSSRKALQGMDSLLSIVQMPAGIPVGTLAIGEAGAVNAALLAAADPGALADDGAGARGSTPGAQRRPPRSPRRRRRVRARADRADRARRDHRHPRRRPARPHAGAWPPPGWAIAATSSSREADSPAAEVAAAAPRAAYDDEAALGALRRARRRRHLRVRERAGRGRRAPGRAAAPVPPGRRGAGGRAGPADGEELPQRASASPTAPSPPVDERRRRSTRGARSASARPAS